MHKRFVALLILFALMGCSTPPSDASPATSIMADAISTFDAGFDTTDQRKLETVSYTHLTLPTKRIV